MDKHPIYTIEESHLVTRRISHPLLGEIAVIEDQSDGRLLLTTYGQGGLTAYYAELDDAFRVVNLHAKALLEAKLRGELDKISAYLNGDI